MALARWQATIVDDAGNVVPGASVEVKREGAGLPLVPVFSDRDGLSAKGNPFLADGEGFAFFHAQGGVYRITASSGGFERVWRYVAIGTAQEADLNALTGDINFNGFFTPDAVVDTLAERDAFNSENKGFSVLVRLDGSLAPGATLYFLVTPGSPATWSGGFAFPAHGSTGFATKAALEAHVFSSPPDLVRIAGYTTAGDGGGALYAKAVSEPSHDGKIQSADGTWWEMAEKEVSPEMFGGFPLSGDAASSIQSALDYPEALYVRLNGRYQVDTGLLISRSLELFGSANNWDVGQSGPAALVSITLIDILTIAGENASNITLRSFNVQGAGSRSGEAVRGIVIGAGGVEVNDAAIDIGISATTLNSATANFSDDDIGKRVSIDGAGASGGTHLTSIASRNSATSVELATAASTTTSGARAYWVWHPNNIRLLGVSTNPLHQYGVHIENCLNPLFTDGGEICGEDAGLRIENRIHSDEGSPIVSDTQFTAESGGSGLHHLSGGDLRLVNCKFLGGAHGYFCDWTQGSSANFLISNNSAEGQSAAAFRFNPDRLTLRVGFTNNTCLAGQLLLVDATATNVVESLTIVGNTGQITAAEAGIEIGKAREFIIDANVIDGQGLATEGILINSVAANGRISRNHIYDCATQIVNNSATVTDASAGQIAFPATQNPSADPNTLDDYEEGTWTPVLTFATPGDLSVAYTRQNGLYTKIGREVHFYCDLTTSTFTHSTASGSMWVLGFPFTATSDVFAQPSAAFQGIDKAGYTTINFQLLGSTLATVVASGMGQVVQGVQPADAPSGGTVILRNAGIYSV